MRPFKITLKNYRCFEDTKPLSLELGPGFTGLVGPNNSGKSSCLKFFYEARQLLDALRNINTLRSISAGGVINAQFLGPDDQVEIFHNRNRRALVVELGFPVDAPYQISRVRLTTDRAQWQAWRGELFAGEPPRKLTAPGGPSPENFVGEPGEIIPVDFSRLWEVCEAFSRSAYVGPFRNAINEGAGTYYDLAIGTTFIDTWDQWKTGPNRQQNEVIQVITDDIARIFEYHRFEINAADNPRTLQAIIDGKPYRLRELGGGLAQFVVVFGNVAIRRPPILLIDEPELNLHPSLQMDFLTSLASYVGEGVMFATHSVGLARTTADRVYSFQKDGYRSIARPFEQTPNFAEFVGEMSFTSFKEMGFDTILLVEGVTEVKAIQQFLRALKKDHKVVVIPLGGSQFIRAGVEAELAELKRLSRNVAVLIDSERTAPNAGVPTARDTFVRACQALGFAAHMTDLRAFENYLTQAAIQAVMGPKYQALGPYQLLRDVTPSWAKADNWRIAREMTDADVLGTDVGKFLASLP